MTGVQILGLVTVAFCFGWLTADAFRQVPDTRRRKSVNTSPPKLGVGDNPTAPRLRAPREVKPW